MHGFGNLQEARAVGVVLMHHVAQLHHDVQDVDVKTCRAAHHFAGLKDRNSQIPNLAQFKKLTMKLRLNI